MSKDDDIRNIQARKRNILFLAFRFLQDNAFYSAADSLRVEARLPVEEFEVCDNVDLDGIYLEYASYHHLKFGKYPKILRKIKQPLKIELGTKRKKSKAGQGAAAPGDISPSRQVAEAAPEELQIVVKKVETSVCCESTEQRNERLMRLQEIEHASGGCVTEDLLNNQDWQCLAELVKSTIMTDELKLTWLDMCGNTQAVEIVKEAVLMPIKYPQLFANGLCPWKSVLLHGPPGSGKTLLAKILYAETRSHVTFFNVTSSVVVSKWRGESEKILRVLFHLAQKHAPSIIFLDEIEGLTSHRDRPNDHESSKRFKNELLQLLDGMEQQMGRVFVLASTNLPWDIDEAFLRRFEKKLLVQLPNELERAILIGRLLPITVTISKEQMEQLVQVSQHFTGDEIRLACKEIGMQTVRRISKGGKINNDMDGEFPVQSAFAQIKPLSVKLMLRHEKWQEEHGS